MWVDWEPPVRQADAATWRLGKLDSWVDPGDVLLNGSRSLHAVGDRGVCIDGAGAHRRWERLNVRCAAWRDLFRCTRTTAAMTRGTPRILRCDGCWACSDEFQERSGIPMHCWLVQAPGHYACRSGAPTPSSSFSHKQCWQHLANLIYADATTVGHWTLHSSARASRRRSPTPTCRRTCAAACTRCWPTISGAHATRISHKLPDGMHSLLANSIWCSRGRR